VTAQQGRGLNSRRLNDPREVCVDRYVNMYVVDGLSSGRVLIYCPDSSVGISILTIGWNNSIGIAVDTNLNLYVSDWNQNIEYY